MVQGEMRSAIIVAQEVRQRGHCHNSFWWHLFCLSFTRKTNFMILVIGPENNNEKNIISYKCLFSKFLFLVSSCDICFGCGANRKCIPQSSLQPPLHRKSISYKCPISETCLNKYAHSFSERLDRYFHFSALPFHLKSDNETFISDGVWL